MTIGGTARTRMSRVAAVLSVSRTKQPYDLSVRTSAFQSTLSRQQTLLDPRLANALLERRQPAGSCWGGDANKRARRCRISLGDVDVIPVVLDGAWRLQGYLLLEQHD